MKRLLLFIAFVAAFSCSQSVFSLDVPKKPLLDVPIVDQTSTLTDTQITALSSQIRSSRGVKDYQIGVLVIGTLGTTETLEGYSLKVAREWGVGSEDKNNGVLLLIAKNDRKLRIEVGSGLEGDLTDIQTKRIIDSVITPKFRNNDFYGGISSGVESMAALIQGKADPNAASSSQGFSLEWYAYILFIGLFFLQWIISVLARTKSWWAGGVFGGIAGTVVGFLTSWAWWSLVLIALLVVFGTILDKVVSNNFTQRKQNGLDPSWWAGGTVFGNSNDGGSFGGGSFGGGGFSGGGSSGSW